MNMDFKNDNVARGPYSVLAAVALAMVFTTTSLAASIPVPAGVNPGETFRIAFVTKATRNAKSPNITDYNAFVTTDALSEFSAADNPGVDWFAIASTSMIVARDNTSTNHTKGIPDADIPIYLIDGTLVSPGNAQLWDATIDQDLDMHLDGTISSVDLVWTGTATDGTASGGNNGVLGAPGGFTTVGRSSADTSTWINFGLFLQQLPKPFYGLSSPITAPSPVPLPAAAWGGMSLLGCLGVVRTLRRSQA